MNVLRVGTKLYGYCGGYFGDLYGDWYEPHHVEAVGSDWVVLRTNNGEAVAATGIEPERLLEFTNQEAVR